MIMIHLLRTGLGLLVIGFSLSAFSADIPSEIEGAEHFNKEQCVANNTNDCIEAVCETSSALDCNDQCRKDAQDKCEALANQ